MYKGRKETKEQKRRKERGEIAGRISKLESTLARNRLGPLFAFASNTVGASGSRTPLDLRVIVHKGAQKILLINLKVLCRHNLSVRVLMNDR